MTLTTLPISHLYSFRVLWIVGWLAILPLTELCGQDREATEMRRLSMADSVTGWASMDNATTIVVAQIDTSRLGVDGIAEACQQQTIHVEMDVPFSAAHGFIRIRSPTEIIGDLPAVLGLSGTLELGEPTRVEKQFLYAIKLRKDLAIEFGIHDTIISNRGPSLADAVAACPPGAPLRAIILPPDYVRQAFRELLPSLPRQLGGGPTKLLTDGFLWAAFTWDPEGVARLEICSASANAAQRLADQFPAMVQALAEASSATKAQVELLARLAVKVEGDRVLIHIDAENLFNGRR